MQPESVRSSDEISLVDVIRVLRKQQKIVYLTVFFALLVGIAIAWFRPQTVVFRQAFSLGSYITNGQVSYLGSPSMLASKLKTIYLPQFIKEYNEKHPANRLMALGSSI
jgi:LPS O-antigen subunit length determinant protein (WzzB/FepE family)